MSTADVRLIPATPTLIDAEQADPRELAMMLGVRLPDDWPPRYHDGIALARVRAALAEPGAAGWWLHYIVAGGAEEAALVGVCGFKGPPVTGVVEVGYSIVPSAQRRGYATEAVATLIGSAVGRGATVVRAETLPSLRPSLAVLAKLGFVEVDPPREGVVAYEWSAAGAGELDPGRGLSLAQLEAEEAEAEADERQQRLIRGGIVLALAVAVFLYVRSTGGGDDAALILGCATAAPGLYFLNAGLRPGRYWEADTPADLAGIAVVYAPLGAGIGWLLSLLI